MPQNKINIALLLGDPSGIGPELVSKLLTKEIVNEANVVVIGEKNIFENGNKISGHSHHVYIPPLLKLCRLSAWAHFNDTLFKRYRRLGRFLATVWKTSGAETPCAKMALGARRIEW